MYPIKSIMLFFLFMTLIGHAVAVDAEVLPQTGLIFPGESLDLNIRVDPIGFPIAGVQTDILYVAV